jgi:hypothetical protein
MQEIFMIRSEIRVENDRPILYLNESPATAVAYTTYFQERGCYEDFYRAGYRIFFINLSFTTLPINNFTGFTPFRVGAFEDPSAPDYSEFEEIVYRVLESCPDAVIFPRIYTAMPSSWVESHPQDTVEAPSGRREILFSEEYRRDASDLLRRTVRHILSRDYASHIGGWQLCGGQTQEWFHHDLRGSLCEAVREPYTRWVKETYGEDGARLPSGDEYPFRGELLQTSENARRYALFCNLGVAETIEILAKVVKEEVGGRQIVGTFYGYTMESNGRVLFGSHALRRLLDSPYVDFFSSPNAYTLARAFGIDWEDMIPVDSVRIHGKMSFIECDIRTHLTGALQDARPGEYPDHLYRYNGRSVFVGPPTVELSRAGLRKSFAHQITKGSAIWWFDMWGGWFDHPLLMEELTAMRMICESERRQGLAPDVAMLADERSYSYIHDLHDENPLMSGIAQTRMAMGNTGVPFDFYACEDADAILDGYKAVVFPFPVASEPAGVHAMALCKQKGIPYLTATPEHPVLTVSEIRAFYEANGIHFYTETEDVVYLGNGYVGLHAATGGRKELHLPKNCSLTPVFGVEAPERIGNTWCFSVEPYETVLFSIEEIF